MPKGYLIGHITVTNPEAYKEYVTRDTPIVEAHGGRFVVRGGRSEVPEGQTNERHVVVEFPSFEAAKGFYDSPEYREVMTIRQANAESVMILVEGA